MLFRSLSVFVEGVTNVTTISDFRIEHSDVHFGMEFALDLMDH